MGVGSSTISPGLEDRDLAKSTPSKIASQAFAQLENARSQWEEMERETGMDKEGFKLNFDEAVMLFSTSKAARCIVVIASSEVEKSSIKYVNPAFERLFGYSAEEIEGQPIALLLRGLLSDDDSNWLSAFRQSATSSLAFIYSKTGHALRSLLTCFPLLSSGDGAMVYCLKFELNTPFSTPLPEAGAEEKMSEEQLDDVLPYLEVGSAVTNFSSSRHARGIVDAFYPFNVRFVNSEWEKLCGYSAREMQNKSLKVLQGELTDKEALRLMISCLKSFEERAQVQTINYNKAGEPMAVIISCTQLHHEGRRGLFYSFEFQVHDAVLEQRLPCSSSPVQHAFCSRGDSIEKVAERNSKPLKKSVRFARRVSVILIPTRDEIDSAIQKFEEP